MNNLSVFGAPKDVALVPTPRHFIPSQPIESAWEATNPFWNRRSRRSGAQKAGLAYEKKVAAFVESPNWVVRRGVWFAYTSGSDLRRYCQPDLLLLDKEHSTCVVVEVKLRWTSDAWFQLRRLYIPVLQKAWPNLLLLPLTICRSYDPAISIPESVSLVQDLMDTKPEAFNVLVYRP